ncbi:hypothetical protein LLH23_17230 [bacterium]|nr:hypothetical protein [bacterium]
MASRAWVSALALLPALAWAAPQQQVAIRAYINVSSGCQAETVDFLNALKAKHRPHVSLEMVDFGDRGKGLKRWQQSGHRCLTIELNGSALVKFPYASKTHAVAFQMPVGFNWTHADLEHAVQAGLQGQLRPATAAEVEAAAPPRQIRATVTTGATTVNGRRCGVVAINGNIAMYIPGAPTAAAKRAQAAAAALKSWLAKPVKMSQLTTQPVTGGWKFLAGGKGVITATAADGKAFGQSAQAVAAKWASGVKYALARANMQ